MIVRGHINELRGISSLHFSVDPSDHVFHLKIFDDCRGYDLVLLIEFYFCCICWVFRKVSNIRSRGTLDFPINFDVFKILNELFG